MTGRPEYTVKPGRGMIPQAQALAALQREDAIAVFKARLCKVAPGVCPEPSFCKPVTGKCHELGSAVAIDARMDSGTDLFFHPAVCRKMKRIDRHVFRGIVQTTAEGLLQAPAGLARNPDQQIKTQGAGIKCADRHICHSDRFIFVGTFQQIMLTAPGCLQSDDPPVDAGITHFFHESSGIITGHRLQTDLHIFAAGEGLFHIHQYMVQSIRAKQSRGSAFNGDGAYYVIIKFTGTALNFLPQCLCIGVDGARLIGTVRITAERTLLYTERNADLQDQWFIHFSYPGKLFCFALFYQSFQVRTSAIWENRRVRRLLNMLMGTLGSGSSVEALAKKTGLSAAKLTKLLMSALPVLLKFLTKNASSAGGAQALLGALAGHRETRTMAEQIENADEQDGAKILDHIFGAQKESVVTSLAKDSELDIPDVSKALSNIAPAMMSGLSAATASASKVDLSDGLDLSDVMGMLGGAAKPAASAGGLLGGLLGGGKSSGGIGSLIGGLFGGGSAQKAEEEDKDLDGSALLGVLTSLMK